MELSDEEREIIDRHRRYRALEDWGPAWPSPLTDAAKVAAYNAIYRTARDEFDRIKDDREVAPSDHRRMYLAVMSLLGPGWKEAAEYHTSETI